LNPPKPISKADALLMRCNTLGDNPNTSRYVKDQCEEWIKDGYFGWTKPITDFHGVPQPKKADHHAVAKKK